ncbi:hypothetical protein FEM48_Zijuj06G0082900 [Ziziphus jujuba var. spinosa]|uniref:Zinc-finger homeodomain protein 5 n=1 Tax=Ziziphus jujuba var. spinosa TaxID=714518 RepID=A0A978V863_ZIZJJ|nr:hypothetical protein FEM48_Zijuj06G0082900 [Ziziphus jujuba var. spinosa]
MEYRAQDNEMRTPGGSLNYIHLTTKESSGGERRRVGIHNGSSTTPGLTCTQTLDYPHHVVQPPPPLHVRDPEPDRVTTGAGAGGPKLKSPTSAGTIRYRECLKNHAANIGGNVFDGCGEFMPSGEEGTLEALKCAACDCHRNFHRKEIDGESQYSPGSRRSLMLTPLQLPPPMPSPSSAGLGHHHHHHHQHQKFSIGYHGNHPMASIVQPMNVAYGSAGGTESSSEDLNMFHSTAEAPVAPQPFALSKKRFRTKFTQEQKDRMFEFAEKMDWRIQKQNEEEVEKFCAEVGVKRQVLKVWMHNNKSTIKKQQQQESSNQSLEMIEADQPEAEAEAEPEGVDN